MGFGGAGGQGWAIGPDASPTAPHRRSAAAELVRVAMRRNMVAGRGADRRRCCFRAAELAGGGVQRGPTSRRWISSLLACTQRR